jgi:hypothetical protein
VVPVGEEEVEEREWRELVRMMVSEVLPELRAMEKEWGRRVVMVSRFRIAWCIVPVVLIW